VSSPSSSRTNKQRTSRHSLPPQTPHIPCVRQRRSAVVSLLCSLIATAHSIRLPLLRTPVAGISQAAWPELTREHQHPSAPHQRRISSPIGIVLPRNPPLETAHSVPGIVYFVLPKSSAVPVSPPAHHKMNQINSLSPGCPPSQVIQPCSPPTPSPLPPVQPLRLLYSSFRQNPTFPIPLPDSSNSPDSNNLNSPFCLEVPFPSFPTLVLHYPPHTSSCPSPNQPRPRLRRSPQFVIPPDFWFLISSFLPPPPLNVWSLEIP
jgi:hypothetical protein